MRKVFEILRSGSISHQLGREVRPLGSKPMWQTPLAMLFALGSHAAFAGVISAGNDHTCALDSVGAVKCWGLNSRGQLGDDTTVNRSIPVNAIGLTDGVMAVASGNGFSCALTSVGGVKCWGANQYGQLGDGSTTDRWAPTNVVGLSSGVKSISVGKSHACAALDDGSAQCWGANETGSLGYNYVQLPMSPQPIPAPLPMGVLADAIAANGIDSVGSYTCALTHDGGVKCWGTNQYGQLGHSGGDLTWNPVDVVGLTGGMVEIAAGASHACALGAEGDVSCWGNNTDGQVGSPDQFDRLLPFSVPGLGGKVTALGAGGNATCAVIDSGEVECWGRNQYAQLGDGTTNSRAVPAQVLGLLGNVKEVTVGDNHACALTDMGHYQCWGSNSVGQVGNSATGQTYQPVDVVGLANGVTATTANCALLGTGEVRCWGNNFYGQIGNGSASASPELIPVDVTNLGGVTAIASSAANSCALLGSGSVSCWGRNDQYQLGDGGAAVDSPAPVAVQDLSDVTALALGGWYSCALTSSGIVKCWGKDGFGNLGMGDNISNVPTPFPVLNINDATAIAAGKWHACAVVSSGGIKCWGQNTFGQLGDGTTTHRSVPTLVDSAALGNGIVSAIAAGDGHTCALVGVGVKCWGQGGNGQLGNGDNAGSSTPVAVASLAGDVKAIATGLRHICALLKSGAVQCWGANNFGQLGDGTNTNRWKPVTVTGLGGAVSSIAANANHTCAVLTTGALKCWGSNNGGELGNGMSGIQPTAAVVVGITADDRLFRNGFE